jgi:hypothetical protein
MLSKLSLGVLGLGLIAILSLGYAGYSALNPHMVTVTGQQYVTNVLTGTTTITSFSTANSQATQTTTTGATAANQFAYQMNCVSGYGCNWPYNYDACWGTGQGNGVACDGYLMQDGNGCVVLAVPTDTVQQPPYNHYSLQNLPSSYPPIGSWVVVKGLLFEGTNSGPNGAACPTNYINVSSIQPTNPPPSP